ncbi:hypothetical protein GQ53DRAFT_740540 [Thozetella sp. PMI_491]|nr:hypothetical protein GQ53DRAFT_740540 [Thozetella sp. PMI_491]
MYFITTAALISAFATGIRASDAVDPGEFIGTFDTFISKVNCDRGGHGITVNGSTFDKCLDLPNGTMEIKSYLPKGYASKSRSLCTYSKAELISSMNSMDYD